MKSRLAGWLVLITGVVLAVRTGTNLVRLWKGGNQTGNLEKQVEEAQKENDSLKARLEEVKSPEFAEREARDKLGYVRPGEELIIIPQIEQDPPSSKTTEGQVANWRKWVKLYLGY